MKIVSSSQGYFMEGLGGAFQKAGADFMVWLPKIKPLLDMMYEIKPDIFFHK